MNNKYLIAAGAIIVVMALMFSRSHKKQNTEQNTEEEITTQVVSTAKIAQTVSADVVAPASFDSTNKVVSHDVEATKVMSENVLRQFANQLRDMNKCLGLNNNSSGDAVEPKIDNLLQNMRASLGDSVLQAEDYMQTEIVDARDGSRKRVRVDYDYSDGNNYSRRLSIYQINAYGAPEIVELTADQSNNPNQAYVESLIEGNKVMAEERGARVYFPQGEEVVFSMKDGILQNLSVNRDQRSFNCFNLGEENSNCSCP